MDQSAYAERWREQWAERVRLWDRRTELETDLSEIATQIKHLSEVLDHLAPLAGVPPDSASLSQLGITDAVRQVLSNTKKQLSASDVRLRLSKKGFDLSGYTAPMATLYRVLNRLSVDGGEVEKQKHENGT